MNAIINSEGNPSKMFPTTEPAVIVDGKVQTPGAAIIVTTDKDGKPKADIIQVDEDFEDAPGEYANNPAGLPQ